MLDDESNLKLRMGLFNFYKKLFSKIAESTNIWYATLIHAVRLSFIFKENEWGKKFLDKCGKK